MIKKKVASGKFSTKAAKYVSKNNVLVPNAGGMIYDEVIANQKVKSKLDSIIGKK